MCKNQVNTEVCGQTLGDGTEMAGACIDAILHFVVCEEERNKGKDYSDYTTQQGASPSLIIF